MARDAERDGAAAVACFAKESGSDRLEDARGRSWEFIVWVWTYPTRRRAEILAKLTALRGAKAVVILSSRRAVSTFLSKVESTR